MKLQNVRTVLNNPLIAAEYARWLVQRRVMGQAPRKRVRSIDITGFTGFSEYLAVNNFISEAEYTFFQTVNIGSGCIIDIGANMGVVSLFLAKRFPDRTIHAIEASPHTAKTLRENIALNDARNVIATECAIADNTGTLHFAADPVSRGTASIASKDGGTNVEVPCTTLDDFAEANAISEIGMLKVDVEGYEALVFSGATATLALCKPNIVYFEICPRITTAAGFDPARPAEMLVEAGYSLHRLDSRGGLIRAEPAEITKIDYANWVAVAG
jgi:FkbM family methyltransferase